jgi:hypothetical protein
MEKTELIKKVEELEKFAKITGDRKDEAYNSFYILVIQFTRNYIGKDTEFYNSLMHYTSVYSNKYYDKFVAASSVLSSIKNYLQSDLELSEEHNYSTKIDIISDFVNQAILLSNDKKFHPAAAAILLGAALEEFLKQLGENRNIDFGDIKKTIDPISKKLYEQGIISKQDLKDITSWAGLRNDATHGDFEAVNDRKRVSNAIEGVNLFMRKYT